MAVGDAVELSANCLACGLEDGVIEIYDALVPACRLGLPASSRCKLCGAAQVAECSACGTSARMITTHPGEALDTEESFGRALDAWAVRDGFGSRQALLDATFCDPDFARLAAQIAEHKPLEVLADPFGAAGMTTRAVAGEHQASAEHAANANDANDAHHDASAQSPPSASPRAPRAIVYPLASVMAADGEIHPRERALVDRFLQRNGLAPLADNELCVHHPSEIAHVVPREERHTALQLMCETAAVSGTIDESERHVIRAYAAAWDIPDSKVDFWLQSYEKKNMSISRRLWMTLRRFVLRTRWSNANTPTSIAPLEPQ
ncbi:MAG: TerB family tellurite resistance protein [Polyangiaceae bacterium]|nr:TerB family tellurite resistance protein [Polyangiaceae bacterium]